MIMANDLDIYGLHGQSREDELANSYIGHEEILGALAEASEALQRGAGFKGALANRLARRTPIVQKVNPTKKRRWVVGFGPAGIPPGTTVTVQSQPQCLFRGEKLVNTGDSTGLYIQGLFIGQKSQLPTFQNPISVVAFVGGVLDNELMLDTCDPALFITFQIQNTSAGTLTWSMAIMGHAVL
jgi:hypothetical protein